MTDERSQRERMLAGDLYIADDPVLARESRRAAELYGAYNAPSPHDPEARRRILAELLGSFGDGSEIRPPFYCDYGYQTHIGAGTFLNFGVVALDVARITIGDDVQIGPLVQLLTPTHPIDARAAAREVGGGGADRDRRQRVARRRRDRLPRSHDRRGHRRRRGRRRDARPSGRSRRGRRAGARHP